MKAFHIPVSRARFLKSMAAASAGFTIPGFLAEALTLSPQTTEGPYYPLADDLPLDADNDLVILNDNLTAATGLVTTLKGRVLDASGNPIRNALVELWCADVNGNYIYSTGVGRNAAADPNFAGFGQFITGSSGWFKFRAIKTGLYTGRTRHFHVAVTVPGQLTRFSTQTGWNETALSLAGTPWATQNANDNVFSTVTNAEQRASMLLNYTPVVGGVNGEVEATWDFVSGFTPLDPTYPQSSGFVVKGSTVAGPNGSQRYKITIPAYTGYTYEVYGNPTLADLDWKCLPFTLTAAGALDRNHHTATADGSLDIFMNTAGVRGFYKVSFRPPGANVGTPSGGGGGGGTTGTLSAVTPNSGTRGTSVTVTASIPGGPGSPPPGTVPSVFTIGGISGTSLSRPSNSTIRGTFAIPAAATAGAKALAATVGTTNYSLANGFTFA